MIIINPPDDSRSEICGKHVSELVQWLELETKYPLDWYVNGNHISPWRSVRKKLFKDYREDSLGVRQHIRNAKIEFSSTMNRLSFSSNHFEKK
jgi:hypothetical protein